MKKIIGEELVKVVNGKVYTTSRIVAKKLRLPHKELMAAIDSMVDGMIDLQLFNPTEMFVETTYVDPLDDRSYPEYLINKDGFFLLGMNYSGKKKTYSKIEIMNAFNILANIPSEYIS